MRINKYVLFFFLVTSLTDGEWKKEAQNIMKYQCGACHSAQLPSAIPKALKVFNLDNENWLNMMKKSKRKNLLQRLEARTNMTDLEVSYLMPRDWKPLPKRPTTKEVELIKSFILESDLNLFNDTK